MLHLTSVSCRTMPKALLDLVNIVTTNTVPLHRVSPCYERNKLGLFEVHSSSYAPNKVYLSSCPFQAVLSDQLRN